MLRDGVAVALTVLSRSVILILQGVWIGLHGIAYPGMGRIAYPLFFILFGSVIRIGRDCIAYPMSV
jgi:hypothetical protein